MGRKYVKVGKQVYSHSSVLRLIELHRHISQDPREIIRSLVRNQLNEARNSLWTGPPFDPRILASIMGIQCEESTELIRSKDAELHPTAAGELVIRYNPDRPRTRQNFSIAHEICHTLFPEYEDRIHARHKIGKYDSDSELEFLCDLGASEIILPGPEFDSNVRQRGVALESLKELSTRYEASREASAIRMIGIGISPCALMVLNYQRRPVEISQIEAAKYQLSLFDDYSSDTPPMKLRVEFCLPSKQFSEFIPKHKSIDESCPLYHVSVTKEEFRGNICLDLNNQILEFYVEAMPIPGTYDADADFGSRVLVFLFQQ